MRLAINIDHIATLRNARGSTQPDPVLAAHIVEQAGADGVVCHLREDRRHIRDRDVYRLRKTVRTKLDLEMAATPEIVRIALCVKPDLVTFVPERRKELTTEGGLDAARHQNRLRTIIRKFHARNIAVSLFVDPVRRQIDAAKGVNADFVEIHTGAYATARVPERRRRILRQIRAMARYARSLGLGVNAGHGLDYANIKPLTRIREIEEVSIGHAIIVRAVFVGLERAVKEMVTLVKGKRN